MVDLFKTLGDLNRLRLVHLLLNRDLCVCELEVLLEMTQSNVSRHLTKLKSIEALSSEKQAQWVHYTISETFKEKNALLIAYLEKEFLSSQVFRSDTERWEKYVGKALNCQHIANDRAQVLAELNQPLMGV